MDQMGDWYSPRRLHESPTTKYDFPGDRFIPNRSLMSLDQARGMLTSSNVKETHHPDFSDEYRKKLTMSLNFDEEGRPFRMMVFRGSPKSCRKSMLHIDEMQRDDAEALSNCGTPRVLRHLPKKATRVLDAPDIRNDYYTNVIDWGNNNILAVVLGQTLYLWNAESISVEKLMAIDGQDNSPSSVAWSEDAKFLAIGYMNSKLEIWDIETSKCIRSLEGHTDRIGTITWNSHILTSGSRDKCFINHDVRERNNTPTSCIRAHTAEVCGLKWSSGGSKLASGGNENALYIWEASKMCAANYLHKFSEHRAAVRALAWCPYQLNVLASGGGTADGCIKLWNVQTGTRICSIETRSQVCGLEWNRHHKEILSGHGYGYGELSNKLCLWKYPSMTKLGQLESHQSRVLDTRQSPDGLTVVSAGGDETLRFWEVFGPPSNELSNSSELDSFLSLRTSPIR